MSTAVAGELIAKAARILGKAYVQTLCIAPANIQGNFAIVDVVSIAVVVVPPGTYMSLRRFFNPVIGLSELLLHLITWNASWLLMQLLDTRFHAAFTAERAWY